MTKQFRWSYALSIALFPMTLGAADLNVNLTTNPPSPQPVGTSITLSATVSGDTDPTPAYVYSYSIASPGGPLQLRRGASRAQSWTWTPVSFEGTFTVSVTVKNLRNGSSGTRSMPYTLTSRLGTAAEAVNATNHPLVALFTGPACQMPNLMRVRFTPMTAPPGGIRTSTTTSLIPCRFDVTSSTPDATSMNFYIAGMYRNTRYNMHWEVVNPAGTLIRSGVDIQFTTGAIPADVALPILSSVGTPSSGTPIVLHSTVTIPVNGRVFAHAASDTAGNVLWYTTNVPPYSTEFGGTYWGALVHPDEYVSGMRQVDLAGNVVAETTIGAVNEQLVAMGKQKITSFHHDIRRIYTGRPEAPNNYILALASADRVSTSAQGGTPQNPVAIIGDMIVVLDPEMRVVWSWNGFDHLDMNVRAIFDEKCQQPPSPGCPPFNPAFPVGNDWTHSNSLQYTPYDGNIIISMRHLDDVLKVNFANGQGDGRVLWKLGNGPTKGLNGAPLPTIQIFTNQTVGNHDLAYPWFSHQHDAEFEFGGALINGARLLTIFDNGNTRQARFNPNAQSRCQVFAMFEEALVANLNRNVDLRSYSFAVGNAQLLPNGNTICDSGFIGGFAAAGTNPRTETTESNANGVIIHRLNARQNSYRTFRMVNMYTPVNP